MRFKSRLILFAFITALFVLLQVHFKISWTIYIYVFCIFLYIYIDRKKFNLAAKWAQTPNDPPPNVGFYEDIIHPIYRHLRQQTRYIENLEHTSNIILSAAQALPSAAVTLTPEFHIEWANKLATK
ncbi:MAG: PAS domain-containing sensor histidine kinase, partial [Alcaligenaceae bacterium]|nr:PAS domain-containing sensor histidine kinase [Alcaligenaceae bacterium]